MRYGMYVIRDTKTEFMRPTTDLNDESAIRNFTFAINNSTDIMGFAPGDFDLYKIGYFDAEKGMFDIADYPVPEFIVSGASVYGVKGSDLD